LTYRWERLGEGQRERAWEMVEQMRRTVTQERQRRRRLFALLIVLVIAAGMALAYLVLRGITL
jgi:fatty acid desaturase